MDMYCSLDDAFNGPMIPPGANAASKKKKKMKEPMTGSQTVFVPGEPDRFAEKPSIPNDVLESPQTQAQAKPIVSSMEDNFFPLPGETSTPDAWQKAFMLEPDWTKSHSMSNGSDTISVDGKPTLWRQIAPGPFPVPVPSSGPSSGPAASMPSTSVQSKTYPDIQRRLDEITQQIEAIAIPTHLQSTAELFLFVAIGLVLLLAIDILLKYATIMALRTSAAQTQSLTGGFKSYPRRLGRAKW
jgi:hypothetical protein